MIKVNKTTEYVYPALLFFFFLSCSLYTYKNPNDPYSPEYHAPAGLTATRSTQNHVYVKWEKLDYAQTYFLYRSREGDTDKSLLITTGDVEYHDYDVVSGVTYCYTVCALLATGIRTGESAEVSGCRNSPRPQFYLRQSNGDDHFALLGERVSVPDGKFRGYMIDLDNHPPGLGLKYKAHIQVVSDTDEVEDGAFIDSHQEVWRIEKIAIRTTGTRAAQFQVIYRAFFKTPGGDTVVEEARNGAFCPTISLDGELQYIEVLLEEVGKGYDARTN